MFGDNSTSGLASRVLPYHVEILGYELPPRAPPNATTLVLSIVFGILGGVLAITIATVLFLRRRRRLKEEDFYIKHGYFENEAAAARHADIVQETRESDSSSGGESSDNAKDEKPKEGVELDTLNHRRSKSDRQASAIVPSAVGAASARSQDQQHRSREPSLSDSLGSASFHEPRGKEEQELSHLDDVDLDLPQEDD